MDELLARASTRVLLVHEGRFLALPDGGARAGADLRPASDPLVLRCASEAEAYFLGSDEDADYLALVLAGGRPEPAPMSATPPDATGPGAVPADDGLSWANLREVSEGLGPRDAGLVATTLALAAWHASHRFCPRCGAATEPSFAGWQRRCVREGSELYPRTDPAVIMAITDDDDRLLLGHATHWPERRFSTLAGFVEAGESAEQALRREVLEEVALAVTDIEYRGSQTWPFPASLMLAYRARATSTLVVVDGVEVGDARWFAREELRAASASGEILLPGRASIARALIEDWYGERLD